MPLTTQPTSLLWRAAALAAALTLASAFDLAAAVRLTYMIAEQPTPITWPQSAFPITYTVDRSAPLIGANDATVRSSFSAWQVDTSNVQFRYAAGSIPAGKDGINTVTTKNGMFDQTGFIAYTTTWFDDRGDLQEADIQVDPNAVNSESLAPVLQHEVGHFLGLDHSANLSATMYPFVGKQLQPLSDDDVNGIAALYPRTSAAASRGTISGRVLMNGQPVFGAQVVALDAQGSPAATALAEKSGRFDLRSLPLGSYRLYVEPLDGPVEGRNLSGVYRDAMTDFRSSSPSAFRSVSLQGASANTDLEVSGGRAKLNPKWVGSFPAGTKDIQLSSMNTMVKSGSTVGIAVGGDGFDATTTFEIEGTLARRVSSFQYGSGFVYATFQLTPTDTLRPLSIVATTGSESAMLTGALVLEPRSGRARPVR